MANPLRPAVLILVVSVLGGLSGLGRADQAPVVRPGDPAVIGSSIKPERDAGYSSYLELRIYSAREGQRDRFLSHFEKYYLESQEEAGMRIWGQFRDLDTSEHFVWMRGYRTMEERLAGLMKFYTGPVWRDTSSVVGEMLVSASHVHFLEPASAADSLDAALDRTSAEHDTGVVVVQVFLVEGNGGTVVQQLRKRLIPALVDRGAKPLGLFLSSDEPNNAPRLPFIEDERVVVWLASFESRAAYESAREAAGSEPSPFETFVLEPGRRSRLYHRGD